MIRVEKVQLQQSQKNPKKLNRFFKFWIEIEYKLPSCNQSCRRSRELLSFEERVCWGMMFVFNSLTYLSTETRKPFLKGVEGRLMIYTYLHSYRHCCHISAVNRPSTCAGWTNRWSCWVVWQLKDVKTHSRLERSQAFIYGSVPAGHLFFKSHIWSIVGFYSAVKHRRVQVWAPSCVVFAHFNPKWGLNPYTTTYTLSGSSPGWMRVQCEITVKCWIMTKPPVNVSDFCTVYRLVLLWVF